MKFDEFIMYAREQKVSDIHMTVDLQIVFRINGELVLPKDLSGITVSNRFILSILNAEQEDRLNSGEDLDFVLELENGARQRINIYRQMGKLACAIRLLNDEIPSLTELRLPPILKTLASKRNGLILVTGATGSGKTTTLSAMIEYINTTRSCHIITIEDPVEYRYKPKKALIHQREIGRDVKDFSYALRSAMREDPDIIFVGELRDYETIQLAITAAETGHLVLATLHTRGAAHTVNRIVDACPANIQQQMLVQISQILEGVISQALLPRADGSGRIAALEILIGTDAVKNIIRSNKCHQLESAMQSGIKTGMCLMDDCILDYYNNDLIISQVALDFANDRIAMKSKLL